MHFGFGRALQTNYPSHSLITILLVTTNPFLFLRAHQNNEFCLEFCNFASIFVDWIINLSGFVSISGGSKSILYYHQGAMVEIYSLTLFV